MSMVDVIFSLLTNMYVLEKYVNIRPKGMDMKTCTQVLMKRTTWHVWLAYGLEDQELTLGYNAKKMKTFPRVDDEMIKNSRLLKMKSNQELM